MSELFEKYWIWVAIAALVWPALRFIFAGCLVPSLQYHMTRVTGHRYYRCNSCRDRWDDDTEDSRPLKRLAADGWLVLPGDVQYCSECRVDVERRVDQHRRR